MRAQAGWGGSSRICNPATESDREITNLPRAHEGAQAGFAILRTKLAGRLQIFREREIDKTTYGGLAEILLGKQECDQVVQFFLCEHVSKHVIDFVRINYPVDFHPILVFFYY